ncbi:hypothetical protein JD969_12980 [Planctomycetota bacterium]|nr:hypothetical protein JD969_12980 [Planctomycetota bacterium]
MQNMQARAQKEWERYNKNNKPHKTKRTFSKRIKIFAITIIFLFTTLVIAYFSWQSYLKNQTESLYASIREAGHPLTGSDVNTRYEFPDKNAADYYLPIFDDLNAELKRVHADAYDPNWNIKRKQILEMINNNGGNDASYLVDDDLDPDTDSNVWVLDQGEVYIKDRNKLSYGLRDSFGIDELKNSPQLDLPNFGKAPEIWLTQTPEELTNDVQTFINNTDKILQKLLNPPTLTGNRWPGDWSGYTSITFDYYRKTNDAVRYLATYHWLCNQLKNSGEALKTLTAMRNIIDLHKTEPNSYGRMFENTEIRSYFCKEVDLALNNHLFNDAQLQQLDNLCDRKISRESMINTLATERAYFLEIINNAHDPDTMQYVSGRISPAQTVLWDYTGIKHLDIKYSLTNYQNSIQQLESNRPDHEIYPRYDFTNNSPSLYLISNHFGNTYTWPTNQAMSSNHALNHLRIAIALERYRLANSTYPESLQDLTPQYLDKIPTDVFSKQGAPFLYRRGKTGCIVYSLGINHTDEKGFTHFGPYASYGYDLEPTIYLTYPDQPPKAIFTELFPEQINTYTEMQEREQRNYFHRRNAEPQEKYSSSNEQ